MSSKLRISRGNKGTIFVLKKSDTNTDEISRLATVQKITDYKISHVCISNIPYNKLLYIHYPYICKILINIALFVYTRYCIIRMF